MNNHTNTLYEKIEKKLIAIMSKNYIKACNERDHLLQEALTIDEYESIIEKTINTYNYNGHNFNPAYLPVIIAMALKEQEFQSIQNVAWNNISQERPSQQNENEILKENLNIVLDRVKTHFDFLKGNNKTEYEKGWDDGSKDIIEVLKIKIEKMTKE